MTPDCELLRRYAELGDEAAFAEVVNRHVDLVYSAALRLVGGDAHLAQDVAQGVFTALARQARKLSRHASIVGWLYTTTRYTAGNFRREQHRRIAREQEAYAMEQPVHIPAAEINWDALQPVLDEAVCALGATDREAVLLRFFENKSHREVGDVLGLGEEAARKRVDRALEKLRAHFARRGVAVTAGVLAATIGANSVQAAPVGLAVTLTGGAMAGVGAESFIGTTLNILSMTTKTKIALTAIIIALVSTTTAVYEHRQATQLRADLAASDKTQSTSSSRLVASPATTTAERLAQIEKIAKLQKPIAELKRELLELFATFKPGDFADLLAAEKKSPHSLFAKLVSGLLVDEWAKDDPAAAIAWVKLNASDDVRADYMLSVFQSWATKDSVAAFTALDQITDASLRTQIQSAVLAIISMQDAAKALGILRQLPLGRQTFESFGTLFSVWADQDPEAASTAALALPNGQSRMVSIMSVANAWAMHDPTAAMAWAVSLPAGAERTNAVNGTLQAIAANDPATAATQINSLPHGPERNQMISTIAASWAISDPAAAMNWVNNVAQGQVQDLAVEKILSQMAQTDPKAAASALANISSASVRDAALPQLATEWAQQDIQGALAWVQSLPTTEGDARATAFQDVLKTWTQNDPVGAAAYVQTMANDPNFGAVASQVVGNWAATDPLAALQWVEALPPNDIRDDTLRTTLKTYAGVDPAAAWAYASQADWAGSQPDNATTGIEIKALGNIAITWSAQDPAQAATEFATLPEGLITHSDIPAIAKNWIREDPQAASQWIDTLAPGRGRDSAVGQLITAEGNNNLPAALAWASTIANPGTRMPFISSVVTSWAQKDPAAVTTAVQSTNFSDSERAQLLTLINKNAPSGLAPAGSTTTVAPAP